MLEEEDSDFVVGAKAIVGLLSICNLIALFIVWSCNVNMHQHTTAVIISIVLSIIGLRWWWPGWKRFLESGGGPP